MWVRLPSCLFAFLLLPLPALAGWTELAPGMDLGTFTSETKTFVGDRRITILRMDPKQWELVATGNSWHPESPARTAKDWAKAQGLTAVINAGMFATDYSTHVGYLGDSQHTNNGKANHYQSLAAFDPKKPKDPAFRIFDLDEDGTTMESILAAYSGAAQNLRLIKHPGTNRWSQQDKKWSEAALGQDKEGRILFIFCRSPLSMHEFNKELLKLGVVAAQHLEGGPEAQLYYNVGDREAEIFGSYETSFREDDTNAAAWAIPNVLGVRPRSKAP